MCVMEEAWLLFLIFLGTGSPFECSGNPLPMRKEGRKSKSLFLTCFGVFFDGFGLFCWLVCQGWLYNCWILCNKAFESRKLNLAVSPAPAAGLCREVVLLLPCCAVLTLSLKLNLALPVPRVGEEGFSSKQLEIFLLHNHFSSFAFCLSPCSTDQGDSSLVNIYDGNL